MTTIFEDLRRLENCAGEAICTVCEDMARGYCQGKGCLFGFEFITKVRYLDLASSGTKRVTRPCQHFDKRQPRNFN